MFATKVLYNMDVRTQNFMKETQKCIFSPKPLDFSSMFEEIVQNRTFYAKLSCSIYIPKRNRDYEENQDRSTRSKKDNKGK